jgi:hypothetical protein
MKTADTLGGTLGGLASDAGDSLIL